MTNDWVNTWKLPMNPVMRQKSREGERSGIVTDLKRIQGLAPSIVAAS